MLQAFRVIAMTEYNHWTTCSEVDGSSKRWWTFAFGTKLSSFVVGACAIIGWIPAQPAVFVVAGLTVIAEVASFQTDRVRAISQRLRRKLEFFDGLGWPIDTSEFSDVLARCPESLKNRIRERTPPSPYFASRQPVGLQRALENLSESSWWSKHLSERMRGVCGIIVALSIVAAIVMLIGSIESISNRTALDAVARVVTSLLLLLLTLGLIRLVFAYHDFAVKSGRAEEAASRLLKEPSTTEIQVVTLLHEYQLARAMAPIIPEWIWRRGRNELNKLWETYRT